MTHTAEHSYRLRQATFEVTNAEGTSVATLDSEEDPASTALTQTLDPGSYQVTLLDSWFLERIDAIDAPVPVNATLLSPATGVADFTVTSGASTSVPYTFATDGTSVVFGPGTLSIPIAVVETGAGPTDPTLDVSVDQTALETELGTTNLISLTVAASGGFSGPVALAGTLLDESMQPMSGWTVTLDQDSVDVPVNGTATATAIVTIPSRNFGLEATARFTVSSAAQAGQNSASVAISALNRYTIGVNVVNGQCVYPAPGITPLTIGTTLRWRNDSSVPIVIHVNGNSNGCGHQSPGSPSQPGADYACTLNGGPGSPFNWYCHEPGPTVNDLRIQAFGP